MNQNSTKYWVILLLTLLLTIQPASAQRTMSGQFSLAVSAHYNGSFLGAEAFLSQYTLIGFWEAGVGGDVSLLPFPTAYGWNMPMWRPGADISSALRVRVIVPLISTQAGARW